jgi:hypothetical protein
MLIKWLVTICDKKMNKKYIISAITIVLVALFVIATGEFLVLGSGQLTDEMMSRLTHWSTGGNQVYRGRSPVASSGSNFNSKTPVNQASSSSVQPQISISTPTQTQDSLQATTVTVAPTVSQTIGQTLTNQPNAIATTTVQNLTSAISPNSGINLGYGISEWKLPILSKSDLMAELNGIKSLGVGWVRFDVDWAIIQSSNSGSFDWSGYDQLVSALNSVGLQGLAIIDYTPIWARQASCASFDTCAPADPLQYALFAQTVAKRYAPQGIHTWEVWNEPNLKQFWKPAANVDQYSVILKNAYTAIKQADPSAIVIAGALSDAPNVDGNISATDFLSQLYNGGAKNYFDAVSIHPYSYPAMPTEAESWNAWTQIATSVPSIRSIMSANGDSKKMLWLTEFGAPTGGPGYVEASANDEAFIGNPDHVTESLQAQIFANAISSYKTMPNMGPLFFYTWKDEGVSSNTKENFFGLMRYDGSAKPAFDTIKSMITVGQ